MVKRITMTIPGFMHIRSLRQNISEPIYIVQKSTQSYILVMCDPHGHRKFVKRMIMAIYVPIVYEND